MTSRALAIAWAAWLLALGSGCGAEPVDARAVWVDELGGDGRRRVHIYDRGALSELEVLGESEPVDRVILDPHGRGLVLRSGARRGVWIDLDDGRRLPLLLDSASLGSDDSLEFADGALAWLDELGAIQVVPLAFGLPLARDEQGVIEPLERGAGYDWSIAADAAPILFVADFGSVTGRASFIRFPADADDPATLTLEAEAEGLSLPGKPREFHDCETSLGCYARVAVEPRGELAMFSRVDTGPWELFDRRAPESAGPLELPSTLAEAQAGPGLRLLAILDRDVSVWIGPGQLYRFDRARAIVDSLPVFAVPPLSWTTADRGRAVIVASSSGTVYRADLTGLRAINGETTECAGARPPVVSPSGRWLAWTCVDTSADVPAYSGVVVRVSAAGLERYVGVPMAALAIDDDGDLLLYSVESSFTDEVDGVGPTSLPRNLFALSGDGALTRIDELEPAPAPVLVGSSVLATYIQGVALESRP